MVSSEDVIGYEPDYLEQAFLREYLGIPESDRTEISFSDAAVLDISDEEAINTSYEMIKLPPIDGVLGGDLLRKYQAVLSYRLKKIRLFPKK